MRLLLTGATGLIGKHVLNRLVQSGNTVRVLALPETVQQIPHHPRVRIRAGGLEDQSLLERAVQSVSIVYHLAGLVPGCPREDLMRVNVNGTRNLLRASLSAGVQRFVFISSTAVYAPPNFRAERNIDESHPLRQTADGYLKHYAHSKIEAERLILQYHHKFGLGYCTLRAPGVYGPQAKWIKQLLPTLLGRPQMTTVPMANLSINWVHVRDITEAVILAGTHSMALNNIFNVAGGEAFSLREMSEGVWKYLTKGAQKTLPALSPPRAGRTLWYDFSKARALLGYIPRVKKSEGFAEIAAVIA